LWKVGTLGEPAYREHAGARQGAAPPGKAAKKPAAERRSGNAAVPALTLLSTRNKSSSHDEQLFICRLLKNIHHQRCVMSEYCDFHSIR